jgi:hypothetical protein
VAAGVAGVSVIELGVNRGSAARNVGMGAVTAPYVALCDDDSWWQPAALVGARILVGAEERHVSPPHVEASVRRLEAS